MFYLLLTAWILTYLLILVNFQVLVFILGSETRQSHEILRKNS